MHSTQVPHVRVQKATFFVADCLQYCTMESFAIEGVHSLTCAMGDNRNMCAVHIPCDVREARSRLLDFPRMLNLSCMCRPPNVLGTKTRNNRLANAHNYSLSCCTGGTELDGNRS